jgi:predicted RNA-binding protein
LCEFEVILGGKTVFKDAVYPKTEGNSIVVRGVLGESVVQELQIVEVDVNCTG